LINSLHQYRQNLDIFINVIEQENWEVLEQKLKLNQQNRPKFVE
ncbi:MAG: arogenate dehydrogenase, partial [Sphaerospermopsis kisseleviana]